MNLALFDIDQWNKDIENGFWEYPLIKSQNIGRIEEAFEYSKRKWRFYRKRWTVVQTYWNPFTFIPQIASYWTLKGAKKNGDIIDCVYLIDAKNKETYILNVPNIYIMDG